MSPTWPRCFPGEELARPPGTPLPWPVHSQPLMDLYRWPSSQLLQELPCWAGHLRAGRSLGERGVGLAVAAVAALASVALNLVRP